MARSRPITFLASGEVPTLQAAGYDVRAIANPLQDLATDSEYVADYLKTIHGPVIRAGHSYGGASRTPRPDSPTSRRWPTSTLPPPRPAKPTPAQWSRLHPGKNTPAQLFFTTSYPGAPAGASELYLNENIFIHNFANDPPRREAEPLWASQRRIHGRVRHAVEGGSLKDHPTLVLHQHGRSDHHGPVGLAMARRAHSRITMFHGGSHLTLISHPNAVTGVLASAICSLH